MLNWLNWLSWLSVSGVSSDGITFGSKAGVALDEKYDAFDEAPNTTTHDGDIGEKDEEAEEEAHEWDAGGEGDHGDRDHDDEEAAAGEGDVEDTFFVFAKIPVVGTE